MPGDPPGGALAAAPAQLRLGGIEQRPQQGRHHRRDLAAGEPFEHLQRQRLFIAEPGAGVGEHPAGTFGAAPHQAAPLRAALCRAVGDQQHQPLLQHLGGRFGDAEGGKAARHVLGAQPAPGTAVVEQDGKNGNVELRIELLGHKAQSEVGHPWGERSLSSGASGNEGNGQGTTVPGTHFGPPKRKCEQQPMRCPPARGVGKAQAGAARAFALLKTLNN